ncbi:2-oxoglutarate dehydrogenase complex dihydrolipoyllysine-residue succinyltransferase [Flavobacterium sp.]|uniref:2-oxoglutarate dehydrogenase complex dihydrolipoyllysine-residue succinyltransferase n=1 Tax=Flavobacterium sp. TaxID=239 RepID=UPI0026199906|nr:2-oxoglutarate dehydrogenase complex dihydrolipoyllysine-residue succinyltransferase [Flavobacterium sp.]
MILEMKVPSPGESIKEVEIATWLVKDGDYVEKDQAIAEVDSDKATLELPAEASGIITLKAEEGDAVAVGAVVCLIDTSAAKPSGDAPAPAKEEAKPVVEAPKAEVKAAPVAEKTYATQAPSPAARKILDEKNIQPTEIVGTGKGGRITKDDAVNAVPSMGTPTTGNRGSERTKLSMLRRKVAERLVSAKNETAMLTTFNEVDMTAIYALRAEYKDAFKEKHGLGLGFMSFFTKAVTRALQLFPDVNSMIDGQEKISYDFCDISVAVSGPKGLMVPVMRNAETLSFRGVEAEIKRLAIRARDGQITVDEMTGGTFTISNGGVFGSMLSTPIINPTQSGILGMHNVVDRAIVKNGQIVIAPVMYVALSYDHRIIDGRESVGFLVAVKEALENPVEHLMGGNAKKALEL